MRKLVRQSALHAANTPAFRAMLHVLDKVVSDQNVGALAVLTYHRIDYASRTPELYPGLISATPEQFGEHLDFLADTGQVVSMGQVLAAVRGEEALPRRAILITFDDACLDFAEYAWPALQTRQLPVTLFVPTAYPDAPERRFWWDRLHMAVSCGKSNCLTTACGQFDLGSSHLRTHAYKRLRDYVKQLDDEDARQFVADLCRQQEVDMPPRSVLGWDALRDLAKQGVVLAPHTQTHPLLTRVTRDQARREIVGSHDDLKREIGDVPPVFAYPGGAWNPQVAELLAEAGIEIAFSVRRGINDLRTTAPLAMQRINIGQSTSVPILRAQLIAGWWKRRPRNRN